MKHDDVKLRDWCKENQFQLIPEHKFHPIRKWRFDFAIPEIFAAIEIEGGVFIQGRHSRGGGMVKDMEKYNHAASLGWAVFRFTPAQFRSGLWRDYLSEYIKERE